MIMKMKLKGRISKDNGNRSLLPITRKVFGSIWYKNVYYVFSEVKMKVAQSCPTLCNLMDCSPPGSSVHGILQARILEWLASPSPGDLPNPGVEPRSSALRAEFLPLEPPGKPLYVLEEPTVLFLSNSF